MRNVVFCSFICLQKVTSLPLSRQQCLTTVFARITFPTVLSVLFYYILLSLWALLQPSNSPCIMSSFAARKKLHSIFRVRARAAERFWFQSISLLFLQYTVENILLCTLVKITFLQLKLDCDTVYFSPRKDYARFETPLFFVCIPRGLLW